MKPFIDLIESLGFKAAENSTSDRGEWTNADGYKIKICITCGRQLTIFTPEGKELLKATMTKILFESDEAPKLMRPLFHPPGFKKT